MGMELFQMDTLKLQPNMSTTNQVSANELKTDSGSSATLTSTNEANSYYRYDTLDLSEGYLNYKTKSENDAAENDTNLQNANQERPKKQKQELPKEIQKALDQLTASSEESDDSTEYNDLSSYTSSELRALFQEGMITQADYNKETESRLEDALTSPTNETITELTAQVQQEKQPAPAQSNQLF